MSRLRSFFSAMAALLVFGSSDNIFAQARVQSDSAKPLIQVRLARETPTSGYRLMAAANAPQGIYVSERAGLSDVDIEHAHGYVRDNGLVLDVQFTEAGVARLAQMAQVDRSDRIAVIIGSQLVAVSVIKDPRVLSARRVQIGIDLPKEEAEEMASAVAARWPSRK